MVRAVIRLLRDKKLSRRLGEAGQRAVRQRFCFSETIHAMEALYEELLQAKGVQV